MDVPEFPLKMPILNRLFVDAHYLFGLERKLDGYDIVHTAETYYHYTQQSLAAKRQGRVRKVVATVLENIPHNNEGIWGRKLFKERSRKELDHMIALTKKTRNALLEEGADERKITVIGHGIDTARFMPDAAQQRRIATKRTGLTVMYAGRLEWYKGIFDILEAFRILRSSPYGESLHLVYVGEGSRKSELRHMVESTGLGTVVSFMSGGYKTMTDFYRKADILVAPSISTLTYEEQYCTVLLEAQAMGLPIVTTRSGGIPENVGSAGLYARERDPGDLSRAIGRFVADPGLRAAYARSARTRATNVHDAKLIAQRIYAVYRNVLGDA
jgi:glycosyltransferase involved in cell wall biosynthesis